MHHFHILALTIVFSILFPLISVASVFEKPPICANKCEDAKQRPPTCKNIGKMGVRIYTAPVYVEEKIGRIVGVCFRQKGNVISTAQGYTRTAIRSSFYYMMKVKKEADLELQPVYKSHLVRKSSPTLHSNPKLYISLVLLPRFLSTLLLA